MRSIRPSKSSLILSVNWFITTALLSLLLSGCAVKVKNERWYGDLGNQGAVYFETLSNSTGAISKPEWDAMRVGMACTSTDTLAEIKKEIEQLCSATPCNYEAVKKILGKFQARLDAINAVSQ